MSCTAPPALGSAPTLRLHYSPCSWMSPYPAPAQLPLLLDLHLPCACTTPPALGSAPTLHLHSSPCSWICPYPAPAQLPLLLDPFLPCACTTPPALGSALSCACTAPPALGSVPTLRLHDSPCSWIHPYLLNFIFNQKYVTIF